MKTTLRQYGVLSFQHTALRAAGLLGILGLLAAAVPVSAQMRPTHKTNPMIDLITADVDTGKAHKSGVKEPVTQQKLADAILAATLRDLNERADEHFHQGEYNHIVNLDRIIVQGYPQDVEAYANSAWLLWSTDRNDEAIAFLKQGITANPNTFYLYDELGAHYAVLMKDPAHALPYYERAVKFDCPYMTWNGLANCYERTNQWDKAVQAWQSAAKYPDDLIAIRRLERARQRLAQVKGHNQ